MLRRTLVAAALAIVAATVSAQPARAVTDPLPQFTNLVGTCSSKISSLDGRCFGASVQTLENNTTNCPGTAQFFVPTSGDLNDVPIDWTYSNGAHACISVSYSLSPASTFGLCEYWFYVPKGFATGEITFGYWIDGVKHTFTLNEDPVSGWQKLFTDAPSSVTNSGIPGGFLDTGPDHVQWSDNNGQPAGAYQLGWGNNADHGIMEVCGGRG